MFNLYKSYIAAVLLAIGVLASECAPTEAAVRIEGQAQVGGGGIGFVSLCHLTGP